MVKSMHQEQAHVVVYNFRQLGSSLECARVALFKATPECIQSLGGQLLPGSEQEVPASELDAQGRYRRVNTGWGELN